MKILATHVKIFCTLLILICNLALAQPTTIGDMTCKDWSSSPTIEKGAWAMGVLSGMNIINVLNKNADVLEKAPSPNMLIKDIYSRCLNNNSEMVSNAIWSVYLDAMIKNK